MVTRRLGRPDADPPLPPSIMVWRSVRVGGDTKTEKSRRTLALPRLCVDALRGHRERQALTRKKAGDLWQENDLVFAGRQGTELDAADVRRAFRVILKRTDLDPDEWTPREMRHSFVSLLSDSGVAPENISCLVGRKGTVVTEQVYRKQLRSVLPEGAGTMNPISPNESAEAQSPRRSKRPLPLTGNGL
ncbi:site-specific recombinase XerD [Streptosporangium becharense]|uniref:Site-specific recombinase XerD n=1 Tax=Streptosporangium becharense TaxID=1816182 RepID=A0A7W9IGP2_9ACTN|nr:tyrosine-type recombinase/integrase [Streptosporangium becharense]MBB2912742.1 site-specific recombinase XerD [Streptosporangium becharense]MBB5820429.1 site-specific recombinase XerD [Streptosporangium becharense]